MKKEENELVEINLYDFNLTVSENLNKDSESYILLKVDKKEIGIAENLYPLPDLSSKCLVSIKKLQRQERMNLLIYDYDTLFGTRYPRFKMYNHSFFTCDERVFFEVLLIKFKAADFKRFNWDLSKIQYELGIGRKRLNSIIIKFYNLGIITQKFRSSEGKKIRKSPFHQGTCFNIDPFKIMELLPSIYADFAIDEVRSDIEKYLKPTLKK